MKSLLHGHIQMFIKFDRIEIEEWFEKNQRLVAWAAVFILFILLQDIYAVTDFPFDSGRYWKLSSLDSLLHFPKKILRGYFFAFVLLLPRSITEWAPLLGNWPYRLISSAVYSYVFVDLLPYFYMTVFGGRVSFLRRLIAPLLIALIFPGLIAYPLSDLPALSLMLGAIVCVLRSRQCATQLGRYCLLILSGFLAYGAYNTRTIFLFPVILFLASFAVVVFRSNSNRTKIAATAVFVLGMLIASVPQILINQQNHGTPSPLVRVISSHRSLYALQLQWGITVQRYETTIGDWSPRPGLRYRDLAGEHIFLDNHLGNPSLSVQDYFNLVWEHPLDFLGIYGRHVINGLDVRDGGAYPESPSSNKTGMAFFNFLVVFAGFTIILVAMITESRLSRRRTEQLFWAFLALLPVLTIIPGAIETRFFVAAHLAFYSAIAFGSDVATIMTMLKKRWLVAALAFGISASVFFAVADTSMASLDFTHPGAFTGGF